MRSVLQFWTDQFVLWVIVVSAAAYAWPGVFTPLAPGIVPGLGVIMFGMGMTLTPADFMRVATMPRAVGCGVVGQFLIMPLLGLGLARLGRLDPPLAMGMIIVGSCPGGTASNVITYLARGDVALSVTMTACSTILAIGLTPLFIWLYGGQYIPVDPVEMFRSLLLIVFIPTIAGLVVRRLLAGRITGVLNVFPAISVLVIVLVIATIVALSRDKLLDAVGRMGMLVVAHNVLGLMLGYALAALVRLPVAARRTVAIEVGMQNSGLGVALAKAHFPAAASALIALPASLFSVVHNLTGALLANLWRRRGAVTDFRGERTPTAPASSASEPRHPGTPA